MIHFVLTQEHTTNAVLPLIALLFKGAAFGAKKHGIKKAIVDTAKDMAKDKIKEKVQKKTSDKENDN
ncbi:MAG TPA: hypothetical protein VNZ45_14125 [Bacteroidia bacterium]|jgi:hypothetical protein|nr:hypothetical protein [Bacteroidia bacterium]